MRTAAARCGPGAPLEEFLERLYELYNRPEFIHPDPLEFVHRYQGAPDREVAGLIASALAYGRVKQILCSVETVLGRMGPSPCAFLLETPRKDIRKMFHSFKHRFTTGDVLAAMLEGAKKLLEEYGSLESCFLSEFDSSAPNIVPALSAFVKKLHIAAGRGMPMFLPFPADGSACKRLNLFLRWMVRRDGVDPGVWRAVPASHLVVPLDTHMHRISLALGLTGRKQADMRCAVEVTENFAAIRPEDPVRYDFALTRLGMNGNGSPDFLDKPAGLPRG